MRAFYKKSCSQHTKNSYIWDMDKKDVIKAFFAGVFSIFPFLQGFQEFRKIDLDKSLIETKRTIPPVKVNLRPVMDDVGDCFNEAGNLLQMSMKGLNR